MSARRMPDDENAAWGRRHNVMRLHKPLERSTDVLHLSGNETVGATRSLLQQSLPPRERKRGHKSFSLSPKCNSPVNVDVGQAANLS